MRKRSVTGNAEADGADGAPEAAMPARAALAATACVAPPRGSDIADVPFSLVLDHADAKLRAVLSATLDRRARKNAQHLQSALVRLRPFWGPIKVGDAHGSQDGWRSHLTGTKVTRGPLDRGGLRRPYAPGTADSDLVRLKACAYALRDDIALLGKVPLVLARHVRAPPDWYERVEIARMLWVVRGRVWDPATGAWKVDDCGRRILLPRKRTRTPSPRRWDGAHWIETNGPAGRPSNIYAWIARLVIGGLYSGSTQVCLHAARWSSSPSGDQTYFDLETPIDGRIGHLHRLGADLAPGAMGGVPVKMSKRLTGHLRRWRTSDAAHGFEHLLHKSAEDTRNERPPSTRLEQRHKEMRRVFVVGGLDPLDYAKLVDTTAVWIIRSGQRRPAPSLEPFVPAPAVMRSAALMIAQPYKDFIERYGPEAPAFMRKQLEALSSLPDTVE